MMLGINWLSNWYANENGTVKVIVTSVLLVWGTYK